MSDLDFREIERERDDRLADEAGEASSEAAAMRELLRAFNSYDPARIAEVATAEQIEEAYTIGLIGPNVASRATRLRERRES
jgi:hypothetical protein